MKKKRKTVQTKKASGDRPASALLYLTISVLVLVPLIFSTSFYTKFSLPKFVVLLIGSSLLLVLLALKSAGDKTSASLVPRPFKSRIVKVVCLYVVLIAVSSLFGVAPVVSLFGSHFNYMGLITRLCFFVLFIALIISVGESEDRLRKVLWPMVGTGFIVALYGVAQAFGIDPFVSPSIYTFSSPDGPLVRVCATLGHSDYLGNFLLYTTPLGAGLALSSRGWLKMAAILATLLSLAAIAFSGTRGAWVGIVVGAAVFVFLELKGKATGAAFSKNRRMVLASVVVSIVILGSIIAVSPASKSISIRTGALLKEGAATSGRNILWRDSLKMVSPFSLIGCGPEGFRKALLGFKSKELARLSPSANNESSHNSYLDTAILFGLPGLIAYIFIIVLAMAQFIRARKKAGSQNLRIILTGLVASFAGVLAHNFFIYDQITTGLYFFAFIALAQIASIITDGTSTTTDARRGEQSGSSNKNVSAGKSPAPNARKRNVWAGPIVAACLSLAAIWYSIGLAKSDMAYKEMFDPANPLDYDALVSYGERVTNSPLPTGAYDYLFARVVQLFVNQLPEASKTLDRSQAGSVDVGAIRAGALALGIEHAEKSLAHTVTPGLNYSLLGALALAAGDVEKLRYGAEEAVKADPNNYYNRWLMAEAFLARGENDRAAVEARTALDLYPASKEAASALARAMGKDPKDETVIAEILSDVRESKSGGEAYDAAALIQRARQYSQAGKFKKAQIRLMAAIRKTGDSCPDCHQELAIVYEKMNRYGDAIVEWEAYLKQSPEAASAEEIKARIETLKEKKNPSK